MEEVVEKYPDRWGAMSECEMDGPRIKSGKLEVVCTETECYEWTVKLAEKGIPFEWRRTTWVEGKATITTISRNKISDCTQYGISTLAVKKISSIAGNTFSKCEKAGMCILGTTCTKMKDNTWNGVKNTNSIMIIKGSNIKKLQNNTLLNNGGKHGISIGNASKVTLISGNTIKTSTNNGICVFENSKVDRIEKNKITGSKIGISILTNNL